MRPRVLALALAVGAAGCGDDPGPGEAPPGGTALWARRFGKSTSGDPIAVAVDGAGDVIVGGRFFATVDFGSGPVTSPANNWQAFVAKYDAAGAALWQRSIGGFFEEQVTAVAADAAGAVYVAGTFRGTIDVGDGPLESELLGIDLFVAKLAADGSAVWSRRIGGPGPDSLQGMVVDDQGGVALAGSVGDGADFGAGPVALGGETFLAKLDASGAALYVTTASAASAAPSAYVNAFGVDSQGAIVVVSAAYEEYSPGGLRVSKLGPTGEPAWTRDLGGSSASVNVLSVGADDAIFLAGGVSGELYLGDGVSSSGRDDRTDAFVAALAPGGGPRWIRRFSPPDVGTDEYGYPIASAVWANGLAAADGGVVLAGSFHRRVDLGGGLRESAGAEAFADGCCPQYSFADDVFAVKLDALGSYLWDTTFGDERQQGATSVAADPSGDVFVGGWSNGDLPFGGGAFAGTPYYDGFLVKLAR